MRFFPNHRRGYARNQGLNITTKSIHHLGHCATSKKNLNNACETFDIGRDGATEVVGCFLRCPPATQCIDVLVKDNKTKTKEKGLKCQ